MARIKDSSVEAVKAGADIVDVVSARTQLRKQGGRYVGRCCLHFHGARDIAHRELNLVQIDALLQQKVFVPDEGRLELLYVRNGEFVREGQLLAEFTSPKLEAEKLEAEGKRNSYIAEMQAALLNARVANDPDVQARFKSDASKAQSQANEEQAKANYIQQQIDKLRNLRAPCDGIVMSAPKPDEIGKNWEKDQPARPPRNLAVR